MSLFGLLLAAHLIGDFPLQHDWIAQHKTERYDALAAHIFVHFLITGLFVAVFAGLTGSAGDIVILWVVGTHTIIDHRRWFEPKESWGDNAQMWVWLNDQILHITALALAKPIVSLL